MHEEQIVLQFQDELNDGHVERQEDSLFIVDMCLEDGLQTINEK